MIKVISNYKKHSFEWGKYDCCMFAADIVLAKTGLDLAVNHRGTYSSQIGSVKAMKKHGSFIDILDANFERIGNINFAKRGDVVSYKGGNGVGVVWSGGVISIHQSTGLSLVLDEIEFIWRVENVK